MESEDADLELKVAEKKVFEFLSSKVSPPRRMRVVEKNGRQYYSGVNLYMILKEIKPGSACDRWRAEKGQYLKYVMHKFEGKGQIPVECVPVEEVFHIAKKAKTTVSRELLDLVGELEPLKSKKKREYLGRKGDIRTIANFTECELEEHRIKEHFPSLIERVANRKCSVMDVRRVEAAVSDSSWFLMGDRPSRHPCCGSFHMYDLSMDWVVEDIVTVLNG